jgi:hypothetical protein
VATSLNSLAALYEAEGRCAQAEPLYHSAQYGCAAFVQHVEALWYRRPICAASCVR